MVGDIFSVLFFLFFTFGQQIFDLAVDGTEKFCFKSGAAEMEEVVRFAVQIAGETAARKGAFPILPPEDCKSCIENR